MKTALALGIALLLVTTPLFADTNVDPIVSHVSVGMYDPPPRRPSKRLLTLGQSSPKYGLTRGATEPAESPILSLSYVPPTTPQAGFLVKVGTLVRPNAVYSYSTKQSGTLSQKVGPGTSVMLPLFELSIVNTVTEIGPAYTTAKIGDTTHQMLGIGFSLALRQVPADQADIMVGGLGVDLSKFSAYFATSVDVDTGEFMPSAGFGFRF